MSDYEKKEKWEPPWPSIDAPTERACPSCKVTNCIQVRDKVIYYEGEVEAYCTECHAALIVQAHVEVIFSDPESL